MDDSGRVIELEDALAERLKIAAARAGATPSSYAALLIAEGLDDGWAEDDARFADYERTGRSVDAEEALLRMRASLIDRSQDPVR